MKSTGFDTHVESIRSARHTRGMTDAPADKPSAKPQPDQQRPPEAAVDETAAVRWRLGAAAIFSLVCGVLMLPFNQLDGLSFALIRVGILAGTAWLAFPTLKRVRWRPRNQVETWLVTLMAGLIAVRPKVFLPIAFAAVVLLLFKIPGSGNKSSSKSERE